MCSSAPVSIGLYWTDKEIFMSLVRMTQGCSIPENVTADVNPYQHMPSNLPEGIWFFIRSQQKKDSEHGFWNARGEACEIFTNSAIIGWRTTLEFYEGRAPPGRRTNWVMQEYSITQKGLNTNGNSKESSVLCRVFLSSGASPNQEMQHKLGGAEIAGGNHFHPKPSVVPSTSSTGQGCTSESQARNRDDNRGPLPAAGGRQNIPVENFEDDFVLIGDYLELDDLADRESQSSSSDNSSCLTMTSDECFDSLALLRELENQTNQEEQGKDANFKYSVAASVRPNEVVMRPANLGSLISSNGSQLPAEDVGKKFLDERVHKNTVRSQKVDSGGEGTSNSHNVATSSSSHRAVSEREKKAQFGRMEMLKKKFLSFKLF